MYKPVRLDAQGRAVWLGAQGKAERRLGRSERRLGRSERRLGGAGEAELLGAQGKVEQRLGRVERLGGAERRLGGAGEAAELLGVPLTLGSYPMRFTNPRRVHHFPRLWHRRNDTHCQMTRHHSLRW